MTRRIAFRLLSVTGIALAATLGIVPAAAAVEISTPYPAVRIQAGESTTFDLNISSSVSEAVNLAVTDAPRGWVTVFRGAGREVDAVHARPDEPGQVQFEVRAPANAKQGVHRITVTADGRSGRAVLPLRLRVVQQAADAFELTTDFPTLRGSDSDSYRFDLTLANHSAQEARFSLEAAGPEGWTVTASPSLEQKAATATVDAGSTTTVVVEADPPDNVSAGTYPIQVSAKGEGVTLTTELTAEVSGSSSFTLNTENERLNASSSAGDTGAVTLLINNDGNAPLQGINLSSTPPSDWEVEFDPETIDVIPPGETAHVTARITPTSDAIAGDYVVTLRAESDGTTKNLEIRYAVETSTWWGLVGVLIILVALGVLAGVYRRFGRR